MEIENTAAEVKPEVSFLFELIRDVVGGRVRIPIFQRRYVWRRDQMLDLLDSIRLQFPIGSLLLWETEQSVASRDSVGPIPISTAGKGVTAYVLDGQQRLSTLVGVLQTPAAESSEQSTAEGTDHWRVWFNAKDNAFEHHKKNDPLEAWHCPLWSMMDTLPFLKECQRIMESKDSQAESYIAKMQKLTQAFTAYKIPVIRLRNTTLSQAVDIFSRLNSKGQKISADEMATALSYDETSGQPVFNLAEEIDRLIDEMQSYGFKSIDRNTILRAYMAAMEVDVYSKDWNNLVNDDKRVGKLKLHEVIAITAAGLKDALTFLRGLGVRTTRLLPYAMQLVALAAFFIKCKDPTPAQRAFLRRWFWVTSFTCHFARGNPSRDNSLVAELRDEISQNPAPTSLRHMRMDTAAEPFPLNFDMRSARSRTVLLVLLSLKPQDENGLAIKEPWRQIEDHGPFAMAHIFANVNEKELVSSPANRIFQIQQGRHKQAKFWLRELGNRQSLFIEEEEVKRDQILASHAIEPETFSLLMADDVENFLHRRCDRIIQIEREFMKIERVSLPLEMEPKPAPIDTE
jgi:Protein of unknown function DUF262